MISCVCTHHDEPCASCVSNFHDQLCPPALSSFLRAVGGQDWAHQSSPLFSICLRTSYAGQANPPLRASLLAREMLCFDAFPRLHASRSHLHSLSLPLYSKYPTRTLHARPSLLARSSSHRYRLLLKVQQRRDRTRSRALLALDITALLVVMASERCFTLAVAEHDSSIAMMLHVNEAWWVHTGPTEWKRGLRSANDLG